MSWRGAGIGSYRYGSRVLWAVDGDLAGSRAERFAGRVELFFRMGQGPLLVDMRRVGFIDSAGAGALARLGATHPDFRVIGRPPHWEDFPLAVRCLLLAVPAAADLESALAPRPEAAAERRRHPRIPLQVPVEIFYAGRFAPAALRDISRGGVRLQVPGPRSAALHDGEAFDILGLAEDPLGHEFFGAAPALVRAARVCGTLDAAVGARFTASPPPV